jgi:hypothetical protein
VAGTSTFLDVVLSLQHGRGKSFMRQRDEIVGHAPALVNGQPCFETQRTQSLLLHFLLAVTFVKTMSSTFCALEVVFLDV